MNYHKLTPIIAKGAIKPRYLEDRFADVVNVKDFGAVGDGIADDWAAVNAALAASKGKGRIVYFPSGTYKISRMISIPTNCSMVGEKKESTIIMRGYARWYDSSSNPHTAMAQLIPETVGGTIRDVLIHNITFDAQGATYPNIGLDILVCSNHGRVYNFELSHCRFLDCVDNHAVDLQRASFVHIHHCDFLGWKMLPVASGVTPVYREAIQFDPFNDVAENRDNHVIIEHCTFGPSDNFGSYYTSIGNHGYDNNTEVNLNHVVIRNNYFTSKGLPDNYNYTNNYIAQISVYIFDDLIIDGNHFDKCNGIKIVQRAYDSQYNENPPAERITAYNGNKNIVICNNHMDGATGVDATPSFPAAVHIYQTSFSNYPTAETTRELATTDNVMVFGNTIENYDRFFILNSSCGLKFLKVTDNHIRNNGGTTLNNLNIGFIIKNNTFENCKMIYISGVFSGATTPKDFFVGYNISDNVFVDPPISSKCLQVSGTIKGIIVKNNIIVDRRTNRASGSYILFNASSVLGGIVADNIVFSNMTTTPYLSLNSDTNTTVAESGNQIFVNNALVV